LSELFSHSRLASFEDCPKKYEFRYVLKIPRDTESIEGFVGKRVHEVLERLYTATGRGHVPTLAQVLRRYRALFDEHYDPERVRVVRQETPVDEYRENGERCLTNYYRRHYPFDADETLGLEERITFDLDGEGRYRILGFVDRISRARDGVIEIHDYKTGRWVPDQKKLDGDRQLALYQIGVTKKLGDGGPMRLVWHYVLRNQVRTSTRTPEQLKSLRSETAELIDRIRGEAHFEPRTSALCSWCEYNDICPAVAGDGCDAARPTPGEAPAGGARRKGGQLPLL
jgi:putative RecB family exonuclease